MITVMGVVLIRLVMDPVVVVCCVVVLSFFVLFDVCSLLIALCAKNVVSRHIINLSKKKMIPQNYEA